MSSPGRGTGRSSTGSRARPGSSSSGAQLLSGGGARAARWVHAIYLVAPDHPLVTDEAIFDLYRRSGNPNFDPNSGNDDNGVDMTVMLSALVAGGIEITHSDGGVETVKPLCFAVHPTDIDTVRAVTSIFGADLWGMDLDTAQQAQTDANPPLWDYVAGSDPWGGHAVPGRPHRFGAAGFPRYRQLAVRSCR